MTGVLNKKNPVESVHEKDSLNKFNRDFKLARAERLRHLKVRASHVPNIKAKLWAVRLQDEALGQEAINLPCPREGSITPNMPLPASKHHEVKYDTEHKPPLQCDRSEGYTIVGNDVEALFPSLLDIESARITRQAVLMSDLQMENMDYELALKYLLVAGGKSHIDEIGLNGVAPRVCSLVIPTKCIHFYLLTIIHAKFSIYLFQFR